MAIKSKCMNTIVALSALPNLVVAQASDNNTTSQQQLNWQQSPNGRGTMDIIWTCLFTVFICVWTAVHLNVPAPPETDTTLDLWMRRLKWVFNCCMIPEIVLMLAAGQYSFARDCWREMQDILAEVDQAYELEDADTADLNADQADVPDVCSIHSPSSEDVSLGPGAGSKTRPVLRGRRSWGQLETVEQRKQRHNDERWTLRHAFFANMGGFRLRDGTGTTYIITAKHVNFLVRKRYIAIPTITTLEINDRSKSDSLAKFLGIIQVGWLAIQCIARASQSLEVTPLEITTLSFIVCTIGTFLAWYRKPYDVQTFTVLEMNRAVEDIDLGYADAQGVHHNLLEEYQQQHPKEDIVDEEGNLMPHHTKLTIIDDGEPTFTKSVTDPYGWLWRRTGPKDPHRIRNDRLPIMPKILTFGVGVLTFAYAALHVAAWNTLLPTRIEQLLWRLSALVMIGCCVVWYFMDHFEEYLAHRRARKGKGTTGAIVPWWRIPASAAVAIIYGVCRSYVLVESFAALRLMPESAYEEVNWGRWIPHI